jgi:hypothetical protein
MTLLPAASRRVADCPSATTRAAVNLGSDPVGGLGLADIRNGLESDAAES